jgi:hypothetical protein
MIAQRRRKDIAMNTDVRPLRNEEGTGRRT